VSEKETRRLRAADRRRAATRRTISENIDRLLGLHRLTSDWAAPLLRVSVTTISYWRNGHREPDNVAILKRLGDFFEIDPFALLASPFIDLLPMIADPERFESVERRLEEGMGAALGTADLLEEMKDSVEEARELKRLHMEGLERRNRKTVSGRGELGELFRASHEAQRAPEK